MRVIDSPTAMAVGLSILGLSAREVATVLGTTADDVRDCLRRNGFDPANLPTTLPEKFKDTLIEDAAYAPGRL